MSDMRPNTSGGNNLLTSTELGLFNLSSPEMLVIQSNGLNSTTADSKMFAHPKGAEQEFADGFVKVLEDLSKYNHLSIGMNPGAMVPSSKNSDVPLYVNLHNCLGELVNTSINTSPEANNYLHPLSSSEQMQSNISIHRSNTVKEEPQIVPEVGCFGRSPSLSPIDMDTQERIKAERKKIRNRIAASKCRKRKLEKISGLEEKVKTLKSQNTDLSSVAGFLREQVAQLKQKVMSHVNSGCQFISDHDTVY